MKLCSSIIEALEKVDIQKTPYTRDWNGKKRKRRRNKKARKQRQYKNRIPKKYSVYINSPYWTIRRNKWYKKFGKKCAICGHSNWVNLHHAFYGEYGFEKDEDLYCLCREHHDLFHRLYGKTQKDMRNETRMFVQTLKSELSEHKI